MQPQNQQQTVVTYQAQPVNAQYVVAARQPTVFQNFPHKRAQVIGITLIVAGVLSIIFNIVELAVYGSNRYYVNGNYYYNTYSVFGTVGHGFWVGILCIITGGFGIGAGRRKTKCLICAFNVMCIIAASFSAAQFIVGMIGAIVGPSMHCYYYNYNYYNYNNYDIPCPMKGTEIAMEAVLAVLAVVEGVAAIWGSVICCRTYCCCKSYSQTGQLQPDMILLPVGAQMAVVNGNQQFVQVQAPVQGYTNFAYQPGYPGQQVQFTALPPAYPPQGQFVPAGQPPQYTLVPQNFQPMVQPMPGFQPQPTVVEQAGMNTSAPAHMNSAEQQDQK